MRVVSRWCRCVVQRLCATDFKRPCLVRAAAPHSAPARMQGVYATRLCRTQSQPSVHSPSPRGRGLGLGIENKLHFSKIDFFYKLTAGCATRRFCLYHTLFYPLTMCHFHHLFKMLLRSLAQIQYVENQQQILNLTPC